MARKGNKAEIVEQISALKAEGLSNRAVAERLGMTKSNVGKYVVNFRIPSKWGQKRICPHCGLAPDAEPA